jgi:HK97 family phage major capsid protein
MNPMLARLQEKAEALRASMNEILVRAAEDGRDDLNEVETKNFEDAERQVTELDERIRHLSELELAAAKAAELRDKVAGATKDAPAVHVRQEGDTYSEEHAARSYFADLYEAKVNGSSAAQDRLKRHAEDLHRATTSGDVTEFIPPAYLVNQYVPKVQSGRPVANAIGNSGAPVAQTWFIPRITQGTTIGYQANELDTLDTQDFDSENITCSLLTIGAYNDFSEQSLRYSSGVAFDKEVFANLARDYAVAVEDLVLNSTKPNNEGMLVVGGVNDVTYDDGTPSVAEFMVAVAEAANAIHTERKDAPNVIVMHPRRWHWIKSASDTTGRPLVTPYAPSNAAGVFGPNAAQGFVGEFYGLPVIASHAVPTFDNGATPSDIDTVIVAKLDDMRLWESGLRTQVDTSSLSNKLGVRFVLSADLAFTAERFPKSISVITGSGLENPFTD